MYCKKIAGKTHDELAKSIKAGAEEFVMQNLKDSGALNTLESCELTCETMQGSIGDNVYNKEEFEHYSKKRAKGPSIFVDFGRKKR